MYLQLVGTVDPDRAATAIAPYAERNERDLENLGSGPPTYSSPASIMALSLRRP